jgi:hypothetical protein
MLNLMSVNSAVLSSMEEGNKFFVLVVRCLKTGGRFVSVRSVTPVAFDTGLRACAKDVNFGAYNSPILESFRDHGTDGHSITLVSAHKTRKQANLAKKGLVEKNAEKAIALNFNRPIKNMPITDFAWFSEEDAKEMVKAKKMRAKKVRAAKKQPAAPSVVAE